MGYDTGTYILDDNARKAWRERVGNRYLVRYKVIGGFDLTGIKVIEISPSGDYVNLLIGSNGLRWVEVEDDICAGSYEIVELLTEKNDTSQQEG